MDISIEFHIMIRLIGYLKILGKCYFLNFQKLKNNFMSFGKYDGVQVYGKVYDSG